MSFLCFSTSGSFSLFFMMLFVSPMLSLCGVCVAFGYVVCVMCVCGGWYASVRCVCESIHAVCATYICSVVCVHVCIRVMCAWFVCGVLVCLWGVCLHDCLLCQYCSGIWGWGLGGGGGTGGDGRPLRRCGARRDPRGSGRTAREVTKDIIKQTCRRGSDDGPCASLAS